MANHPRNVAVFIFDEVEVLDFCGPFEVFSVTGRRDGSNPYIEPLLSVCTGDLILAKAGLLEGLAATTHHGAISLLQEKAKILSVKSVESAYKKNGKRI